jgi:hypothetical protein
MIVLKRRYQTPSQIGAASVGIVDIYRDDQLVAVVRAPSPIIGEHDWRAIGYRLFPRAGTAAAFGNFSSRRAALDAAMAWARSPELD